MKRIVTFGRRSKSLRRLLPALLIPAASQFLCGQAPPKLSLRQAELEALRSHPQVLAARSEIGAASEQITESRSAYYPEVTGSLTGSQANVNSRIGAGILTASRLFNRFGQGIEFSQLITDSGRTPNLVASSRLQAQATTQDYQATRYDVLLQVNRAYFDALHAENVVKVANETIAARQTLLDQVTTLFQNKLKSQLDVSFASVNVSQAKLMLIRAQDSVQQAFAELARAMGSNQPVTYQLVDEPEPPKPPATPNDLVSQAMRNRPELVSAQYSRDAAYRFLQAEKDLNRPTVSLGGVAGFLPLINQPASGPQIPNEYEGAAVNVNIPVFNGHLFSARRQAASYRAAVSDQHLRDAQQRVARDVRVAWADSVTAFQRIGVSVQLMNDAKLALDLAQGRYQLGLASIVELTQAQLNLTDAELENLSAKYDYQTQYAALQYALGLLR